MSTDLVISNSHEQAPSALATVMGVQPKELMTYAVQIADTLTDVLRDRGMTQKFGQGEHVKTEGWQLAGSLIGFTTEELGVEELPDGSFAAKVGLKSIATGRMVASASGYCGSDEKTWGGKPKYARRGMAITRAIGRVYAQNFRWLIRLAGYEGTPAEEMPDVVQQPSPVSATSLYMGTVPQKEFIQAKLKQQGVSEELWAEIGERLKGRPIAELRMAFEETQTANGAFA